MPFVTVQPSSDAAATTLPPGHMQKEYTAAVIGELVIGCGHKRRENSVLRSVYGGLAVLYAHAHCKGLCLKRHACGKQGREGVPCAVPESKYERSRQRVIARGAGDGKFRKGTVFYFYTL